MYMAHCLVTNAFVFLGVIKVFIYVILMLYFVTGPYGRPEGYLYFPLNYDPD